MAGGGKHAGKLSPDPGKAIRFGCGAHCIASVGDARTCCFSADAGATAGLRKCVGRNIVAIVVAWRGRHMLRLTQHTGYGTRHKQVVLGQDYRNLRRLRLNAKASYGSIP